MKDILAVTDTAHPYSRALHFGAELAGAYGAWLTGLLVVEPFAKPAFHDAAAAALRETKVHETLHRAREDRATFARLMRDHGVVSGDWQVAHGPFQESLRIAASWHDLVVLGLAPADGASIDRASRAVLGTALPCIVVPETHSGAAAPECVAVASNGSPEAIGAMHAALPLLRRARHVVLLKGRQKRPLLTALVEPPCTDVEGHLRRHDIAYERRTLDEPEQGSGEEILDAAVRAEANLLVMGAYGRSRLSEWVLGGATRHALQTTRIPLLLRH